MTKVRLTTAGESHGPAEVCILEGIPAGLALCADDIDAELARRQRGYGRGGRMTIETDRCEIIAGVRLGKTMGSPIAILVRNRDHENWLGSMGVDPPEESSTSLVESSLPRPGHADYAGMLKYGHSSLRPVLERASARETVARVAGGAVCRRVLEELGVKVRGRVVSIGEEPASHGSVDYVRPEAVDWEAIEASPVAVEDEIAAESMCKAVDAAREAGESLGGVFEVWAWGMPPGLGDNTRFEKRLDGRLLGSVGSIPAIKGVELGRAFDNARLKGSEVHDEFMVDQGAEGTSTVRRPTNRAAGIEGGMTNGMPVVVRAAMKPIPTLTKPLISVELSTLEERSAHVERSDVMAVPAARVVGEAMVCMVLVDAFLDKFGGDSLEALKSSVAAYVCDLGEQGLWRQS